MVQELCPGNLCDRRHGRSRPRGTGADAWRSSGRTSGFIVQAVAAVPLLQRLLGVATVVPLAFPLGYLAPRSRELQHDPHHLRRFRQRGVDGRGKGVHELRPARVVEPQGAAAQAAEVPACGALPRLLILRVLYPGVEASYVLLAFDLHRGEVGTEVYGVAPAACGLAADGAVAGLVGVGRGRIDCEAHRAAVARAAKFHVWTLLPLGATAPSF